MPKSDQIIINMGPQHPSTHGVYRCVLTLEGEVVVNCENVIGYLHRGVEKLAEDRTYTQFLPFTDRTDYVAAILNNLGYILTVEKLVDVEIPPRAEYLRIIMSELQRIASHQVYLASFALDLASFTGWMYCFRDREKILDLFESVNGTRLTHSYIRVGGVAEDVNDRVLKELDELLDYLPEGLDEFEELVAGNEILRARTIGIGTVSRAMAMEFGFSGPNARASGIDWDLRRDDPYGLYGEFDINVPVLHNGDSMDRFMMRILEIRQSIDIIRQALSRIPGGPILAKVPRVIKTHEGEAFHQIEGAKGHLGHYIVSDGTARPYRLHIYPPTLIHLWAFPKMVLGSYMQDVVAILASIDIVMGEVDR